MYNSISQQKKSILLLIAAILFSVSIALAAISQFPIFLIDSPPPNVMIMLDNSLSMDGIMQHAGYTPSTTYTGVFRHELYYQKTNYTTGIPSLETRDRSDVLTGTAAGIFTRNSRSITLPLPYVNTQWDGNYLNWLFYHATASQYQALSTDPALQKTRMQTAQGVIGNLVKNVSGIRFGLAKFNGTSSDGGKIVATCGTLTAANVDTTVNAIIAETYTPLGETLAEIWHYFKGGASPYNSGTTYTTPISASCQKNFVIVVTDGEPTFDGCYKGDFSSYGCSTTMTASSRLADIAGYMCTHTAVSSYAGSVVNTYTIGLTLDSTLLRNAAANGGGEYYTTATGITLDTALRNALNSITERSTSGSAAAVSTGYLSSDTRLYRGMFDSRNWTGSLECWALSTNDATKGDLVGYPTFPLWEAGALLDSRSNDRVIYTAATISGTYKRLNFVTSSTEQTSVAAQFTNFSTSWIQYVRDEPKFSQNPTAYPSGYRARTGRLGDMINSPPTYFGPPNALYDYNNYRLFKKSNADRIKVILVGANDGMLHAFRADNGEEAWGFIPSSLLNRLKLLRSVPYVHTNYVNGAITTGDAFIASKNSSGVTDTAAAWHSIAVCGLREGGKSFFALDLTNPLDPIPLWELSSSSTNGLGYSFGTPLIVRIESSEWVAILPNGYESPTSGKAASLIVVNLATGSIIREMVVDTAHPNGLASPAAVDTNGDGYVDTIYAGDLKGQLWKFDVSDADPSKWSWVLLFSAKDAPTTTGIPQPITTAPEVILRGGYRIVFVGTGKYLETADKSSTQIQSFYGIFDDDKSKNMVKSDLAKQTVTQVTQGGVTWRVSSENPIGTKKGWYLDLPIAGERVITDPVARSQKIIFTTFIPSSDPCTPGGVSWLMELNIVTGGTLLKPAFDVTGDNLVNSSDMVAIGDASKMPTGILLGEGIATTPAIIGTDGGLEYKFISRSTGEITKILEGGASSQFGPRSWRILKFSTEGY